MYDNYQCVILIKMTFSLSLSLYALHLFSFISNNQKQTLKLPFFMLVWKLYSFYKYFIYIFVFSSKSVLFIFTFFNKFISFFFFLGGFNDKLYNDHENVGLFLFSFCFSGGMKLWIFLMG